MTNSFKKKVNICLHNMESEVVLYFTKKEYNDSNIYILLLFST